MTAEQTAAYVAALNRERDGYVARIKATEAGKLGPLTVEQLQARVDSVDAELKRVGAGKAKAAA